MFGPDTPLVIDALQMVGLALVAGAGGVWLLLRRRKKHKPRAEVSHKSELEERVRVLERIATDRTQDLKDEIEQLRDAPAKREEA
ncbi:MAG: hypothetical protein AAGL68_01525 [Pseudomonadota bacterium]